MTGVGHRLTGLGALFIAAGIARLSGLGGLHEATAALLAASSTTLPDWLEWPRFRDGKMVGRLIEHRTITHWVPLWVALLTAGIWHAPTSPELAAVSIGLATGALTHLLGDAPNPMGVPWLLPYRRIRFGKQGWWRSGQYEGLLCMGYAIVGWEFWRQTGGALPMHLSGNPWAVLSLDESALEQWWAELVRRLAALRHS